MTGFFKDLVNERNKNGVFNDIGDIRTRLDPNVREKIRELINLIKRLFKFY
jgi:DNA uptake protein ComE-like DNA-binding protein